MKITASCFVVTDAEVIYEPAHGNKQQNDIAPSEDSDQPGHPPSLIRVFAGHTSHFVGFILLWL